jgi:hypothetical protein
MYVCMSVYVHVRLEVDEGERDAGVGAECSKQTVGQVHCLRLDDVIPWRVVGKT